MSSPVPTTSPAPLAFVCGDRRFLFDGTPRLMGIVNVTPDSFSDGGEFLDPAAAVAHGASLAAAGAEFLDVGGESSRPGAAPVPEAEELRRVLPVIRGLAEQCPAAVISIDTTKAAVARRAIEAGACIVNDISGLRRDPDMLGVLAETGAGAVAMHMRGTPATMQRHTDYADLVGEIGAFFRETLERAARAGVAPERLMLDPGIGFSKTAIQNYALMAAVPGWRAELQRPILLGPSRKSFLGAVLPHTTPKQRGWATAAAVAGAVLLHADVLRVHDVAAMHDAARVALEIRRAIEAQAQA